MLVIRNAENPGVGRGSSLFLRAKNWACQVTVNVIHVAGNWVAHTAGSAGPAAGNVVQGTVGEDQATENV